MLDELLDHQRSTPLWVRNPCVLLEHPLDVWPFACHRSVAANVNAAVRALLYATVFASVATRSVRVLLVGLVVILVVTALGYWYEQSHSSARARHAVVGIYEPATSLVASLQHPDNSALPSDGTLQGMIRALQGQRSAPDAKRSPAPAADVAEKFMSNCQTQPWAPVQPTPLFPVPRTGELEHQLLSGQSTGNPLVSPQNPMGNPLTYDYYTAVNMDKPLASSVPQQEYTRFFNSQTEFPEGLFFHPVPDQTGMARPVYFPQSSEAGRSILQYLGTGYVGR